jgi:hypothetical protein
MGVSVGGIDVSVGAIVTSAAVGDEMITTSVGASVGATGDPQAVSSKPSNRQILAVVDIFRMTTLYPLGGVTDSAQTERPSSYCTRGCQSRQVVAQVANLCYTVFPGI